MLQLVVLYFLSWLLLHVVEKRSVEVLGLHLNWQRLSYSSLLFLVSAACCALGFLLRMYLAQESYIWGPSFTSNSFFMEIWNQFRSVLTEELICRGALLYMMIRRFGPAKSILISSLIFAILHWLNAGVWGNLTQMALVFLFTFVMGLLLAYAYARTFSMLLPIAIHFGWNLTQNYIFPDNPAGQHLFVLAGPPPTVTISYLAFFTMLLLPKISLFILNTLIVRHHAKITMP